MQHEAMLNELMELILSGDPVESDIHQLYAGLQPHLQALADWLHVARTDIRIEIQPNVYEIRGRTETFGNTYHDEIGGEPLVLAYPHLSHIVGTAMIYPWRGHAWNETELHRIKAISNLLVLEFSCANMTKRAKKTPYIDLLTGLSNNPGVAYYGARMEQQYDMSKYAGCFINLKNFKYIKNQLGNAGGDEAMRQYRREISGDRDHGVLVLREFQCAGALHQGHAREWDQGLAGRLRHGLLLSQYAQEPRPRHGQARQELL